MAAMVATSPAMPPAPLGSLALKHITQAGGGGSAAGSSVAVAGVGSGVMGSRPERGNRGGIVEVGR
jgi:hypothetical protein